MEGKNVNFYKIFINNNELHEKIISTCGNESYLFKVS